MKSDCPHRTGNQCALVAAISGRRFGVTDATCAACRPQWRNDEPPTEKRPTQTVRNLCAAAERRGSTLLNAAAVDYHGERVGDRFARLSAERMDCQACPACEKTRDLMNAWGPAGCRERLAEIVTGIVPRALKCAVKDASWRQVYSAIKDAWSAGGITAAVERLVLQAIEETEAAGPPRPFDPRITVGVTAFNRPAKLRQFLRSLWHWHPTASVIIADNGNDQLADADVAALAGKAEWKYLRLPFDVGLSASRNASIDALETDLMLLCEDDFIVDERMDLAAMVDVLDSNPDVGVCAGACERSYRGRPQTATLALDRVTRERGLPGWRTPAGTPYTLVEWVSNFALFRRAMLTDHRWDDSLLMGEHTAFYLDVQAANRWGVALTPVSQIGHSHDNEDPVEYRPMRSRASMFHDQAMRTRGALHTPSRLAVESPRCVLVVTVGCSGSSIVAGLLRELGVFMGYQFAPPTGGFDYDMHEDRRALEILNAAAHSGDWSAWPEFVAQRNATQPVWGVKNPRLSLRWEHLRTAPYPADTRVVVCVRDRAETIDSLHRRTGRCDAASLYAERTALLRTMVADAESRGWPVLSINMADSLASPTDMRCRLAEFVEV